MEPKPLLETNILLERILACYVAAWNGLLLETNLLLERMLANMWLLGTELLW